MAKEGKSLLWVVVIGLTLLLAYSWGYIQLPWLTTQVPIVPVPPTPGTAWDQGGWNLGFLYVEEDASSGGSLTTTSPSYRVFHSNGRRLSGVSTLYGESGTSIASGSTATKFGILGTDKGIVFVSVHLGDNDLVNVESIRTNNPGYVDSKWVDVDTQNKPRLVMELDLRKYGEPSTQYDPAMTVTLKMRGSDEDTSVTMSAPADQTGIGTTAGTEKTIEWTITAITADDAACFVEIYVTSNETAHDFDAFEITLGRNKPIKLNDPWASKLSELPVIAEYKTAGGITQSWYYIDGKSLLANSLLLVDPTGGDDGMSIKVRVKTYFTTSGHGATCVLNIKLIDADGTVQTAVTDSMVLQG